MQPSFEQQSPPAAAPLQTVGRGGISPETEELLQKYLKLSIRVIYWNIISRIIIILLIAASFFASIKLLVPIVSSQFATLMSLQNTVNSLSDQYPKEASMAPINIEGVVKALLPKTADNLDEIAAQKQAHNEQIDSLNDQ